MGCTPMERTQDSGRKVIRWQHEYGVYKNLEEGTVHVLDNAWHLWQDRTGLVTRRNQVSYVCTGHGFPTTCGLDSGPQITPWHGLLDCSVVFTTESPVVSTSCLLHVCSVHLGKFPVMLIFMYPGSLSNAFCARVDVVWWEIHSRILTCYSSRI